MLKLYIPFCYIAFLALLTSCSETSFKATNVSAKTQESEQYAASARTPSFAEALKKFIESDDSNGDPKDSLIAKTNQKDTSDLDNLKEFVDAIDASKFKDLKKLDPKSIETPDQLKEDLENLTPQQIEDILKSLKKPSIRGSMNEVQISDLVKDSDAQDNLPKKDEEDKKNEPSSKEDSLFEKGPPEIWVEKSIGIECPEGQILSGIDSFDRSNWKPICSKVVSTFVSANEIENDHTSTNTEKKIDGDWDACYISNAQFGFIGKDPYFDCQVSHAGGRKWKIYAGASQASNLCSARCWKFEPVKQAEGKNNISCPKGQALRGVSDQGEPLCSVVSVNNYKEWSVENDTTSVSRDEHLGDWAFCALANVQGGPRNDSPYSDCQISTTTGGWKLHMAASRASMTCAANCWKLQPVEKAGNSCAPGEFLRGIRADFTTICTKPQAKPYVKPVGVGGQSNHTASGMPADFCAVGNFEYNIYPNRGPEGFYIDAQTSMDGDARTWKTFGSVSGGNLLVATNCFSF